jgi:hypothetical protein
MEFGENIIPPAGCKPTAPESQAGWRA